MWQFFLDIILDNFGKLINGGVFKFTEKNKRDPPRLFGTSEYLLNDDFGGKFQNIGENSFSPKLFTEIFGDLIKKPTEHLFHRKYFHRKFSHQTFSQLMSSTLYF